MIGLALTSLRYRLAAVLATFLAVLVGAGLLVACGGIFETAIRLDAPAQRLAGAPVVLTGPTRYEFANRSGSANLPERPTLDPRRSAEVGAMPGVARAVPDASFPAVLLSKGRPINRGGDPAAG